MRHEDDERVIAQDDAVEVFVNGGEQLSGVEFVVAQGLLDGERTLFEEGQFDAGPLAAEAEQGVAEQVAAEQCQTQPQRAAFDGGNRRCGRAAGRVRAGGSARGGTLLRRWVWWRPGVFAAVFFNQQRHTQLFFQCLYGFAGRWVGSG